MSEEINIEDFAKLDLRIARVVRVEAHPNADKLLKIAIDLGYEERQIVAGIAPYYEAQDLVGKLIAVVTNLKPVKLRGELSQGMLLAATGSDRITVLTPMNDVEPGSKVS